MKNKKASVSLLIVFFITAIIIVLISAVLAPLGVTFNTQMYQAGERMLKANNDSINAINNATVRENLLGATSNALAAGENNIEINNAMFQYGWLFLIVLTLLILFMFSRRLVGVGGGGLS